MLGKLYDRFGKKPGGGDGIGRYFLWGVCEELRSNGRTLDNVMSALRLMKASALLAKDEKIATEFNDMIEALEQVKKNLDRTADDYDPRREK